MKEARKHFNSKWTKGKVRSLKKLIKSAKLLQDSVRRGEKSKLQNSHQDEE